MPAHPRQFSPAQIICWRIGAIVALLIGLVGLVLPVLPTVPFVIVSAWAAGKGWPALEARLLAHPFYGPHIRRWRERGAITRRAKWLATVTMLGSVGLLQLTQAPQWAKAAVVAIVVIALLWIWSRPEQ